MTTWFRDVLFWRRRDSFAQSAAYMLLVVIVSLIAVRSAWHLDGTRLTDTHASLSLDLAFARVNCGIPSSFSQQIRIPLDVAANMALRHEPLRALVIRKAGSIDAYCRGVDVPFVNSENSLMALETALLRARPNLSLAQVGNALHLIRIGCVIVFVLLLFDLGSSIWLGLATLLCGLMLLQAMPDFLYSNYPFLFTLTLLVAALHGFAIRHRWTDRWSGILIYGSAAGALSAFTANMRTSYLPIVVLFFGFVLADALRRRGAAPPWPQRAVRGVVLAVAFALGYAAFQQGVIGRSLPAGEARFNASHPFAHPLVLGLAVPQSDFSRSQGIRWADEVGPQIAARVDPGAPFLGPRYNTALLTYYKSLWRAHPREMINLYATKLAVAGSDMMRVLRASPGPIGWAVGMLLTPLALLPDGRWLLGLYAAITLGALTVYHRHDQPAAFALALLSLAACLTLIESGVIFSIFVKQYHNYSAFFALFLSLLGLQAGLEGVRVLAARR